MQSSVRRVFVLSAELAKALLDLVVERKTSLLGLREDQFAVDQNVELPRFARSDFDLFVKA